MKRKKAMFEENFIIFAYCCIADLYDEILKEGSGGWNANNYIY